jgi:HK97 family phage major capsid protein
MNIATIERQIRDHAAKADALVNRADAENRPLSQSERAQIDSALAECVRLDKRRKDAVAVQGQLNQLKALGGPVPDEGTPDSVPSWMRPNGDTRRNDTRRASSAGETFVNSAAYKQLVANRGAADAPWANRRIGMDPVQATGLWRPRNALVTGSSEELLGTSTDSAGVLVRPEYGGVLPPTYARELKLRDLVSTVPTATDTIEYAKVASVTNAAAAVAEATTSAAPTAPPEGGPLVRASGGGYKPESSITFDQATEHVRTIAHTLPVTKKALADARQLRMIIDTFMRYGLDEEVEDLMLVGDGVGEHFLGLLDTSREQSAPGVLDGVQIYTVGTSGDGLLEVARRLKTRSVLGRGGQPTAYLASPLTVERFELLKDAEERFYIGGPFAGSTEEQLALWRLPLIGSEAVPDDLLVTGNFRQAVFYDREQATIQASDSHEDFFIRNLVMILAELRGGFAVLHEPSFVKCDVTGL